MDKENFGNFIRELRIKKKYTQSMLANILCIDVSAVSKWERGISYPDITLIPKICEALDANEHELIQSSYDYESKKIIEEGIKFISIKNLVFWIMSITYLITIITCFIVNICVSKKLSWFFIVFSSCLTGFAFLPTATRFFKKNKFLWYIITTYLSLVILYVTCSLYTKNYWCLIASIGTFLGYFLLFFPYVFNKKILYLNDKYEENKKYFIIFYAIGLMLLTILLLSSIDLYIKFDFSKALIITLYSYLILIIIGLVRLFKINRFLRLGIDFLLTDVYLVLLKFVLEKLFGKSDIYGYKVNFSDWVHYTNGNVCFIILLVFFLIAVILFIIGFNYKKVQTKCNKKSKL